SKELKARMQGKTCFNFKSCKSCDEALFKELAQLTAQGIAGFRKAGFRRCVPAGRAAAANRDSHQGEFSPHAGVSSSLRNSSRIAITCSRRTLGKPSRKSSIDSPASRWSNKLCTGTRVP